MPGWFAMVTANGWDKLPDEVAKITAAEKFY